MAGGSVSGPLIVTAELPPGIARWATDLRRRHYPAEHNRLDAHVTLFHALPPSALAEVRAALSEEAAAHAPPEVRIDGIMPLGTGTALRIVSADMLAIRDALADRFHGLLSAQDGHRPRLHITIQNKVAAVAARALQRELEDLPARAFRFSGLGLHIYRGGPWEFVRNWPFHGAVW